MTSAVPSQGCWKKYQGMAGEEVGAVEINSGLGAGTLAAPKTLSHAFVGRDLPCQSSKLL